MKAITLYRKLNQVKYDYVTKILRRERRPSPSLARELEQVTGISRLAWLYPDEFHNPMIDLYQRRNRAKRKQNCLKDKGDGENE
jgi:hypothetical protein